MMTRDQMFDQLARHLANLLSFPSDLAAARRILHGTSLLGMWWDVREFHQKFNVPAPEKPTELTQAQKDLRKKLIREECEELCEAIDSGDLGKIAHEGVDVMVVTLGTFVTAGINPQVPWTRVHAANMKKMANPDGGKILKPEGWQPADVASAVRDQMAA